MLLFVLQFGIGWAFGLGLGLTFGILPAALPLPAMMDGLDYAQPCAANGRDPRCQCGWCEVERVVAKFTNGAIQGGSGPHSFCWRCWRRRLLLPGWHSPPASKRKTATAVGRICFQNGILTRPAAQNSTRPRSTRHPSERKTAGPAES